MFEPEIPVQPHWCFNEKFFVDHEDRYLKRNGTVLQCDCGQFILRKNGEWVMVSEKDADKAMK